MKQHALLRFWAVCRNHIYQFQIHLYGIIYGALILKGLLKAEYIYSDEGTD